MRPKHPLAPLLTRRGASERGGVGTRRSEWRRPALLRATEVSVTSSVDTPTETAESGGFQNAPKRRRRQRGGVRRKRHGGGKSAQADPNPSKHGTEPVSLSRPPAKTQKVSQVKVAATKIAEKMSKAAAAKIVTAAKARHEFVSKREELMKPVRAFGDRVRFLPSIPATDARPIRNIGWNNALVEMAQQSRAFVRLYALEHLRLVGHIKRLGLGRQLGDDNLEDMLDVVAS